MHRTQDSVLSSQFSEETNPSPFALRPSPSRSEGFVSIFSVLIIMSILTLIAIGFSNITRQAQRRTLDNQLSTQAFYAAESGINDAKKALTLNSSYSKTDCVGQDAGNSFKYTLDASLNVAYSCVQVNPTPGNISFSSIGIEGSGDAKTVNLEPSNGAPTNRFSVSWDSTASGNAVPNVSTPDLTPRTTQGAVPGWDTKVGILRMDVIPATGSDWTRDPLTANTYSFFLYPTSNSAGATGSITFNPGHSEQGKIALVKCNNATGLRCKADIVLAGTNVSRYILRLSSIYNDVQVDIGNVLDGSGTAVTLKNGQAVIDATGRAGDVFRRIQVRLPLTPSGGATTGFSPSFGILSADSICKRLAVGPTTTVDDGDIPTVPAKASCQIN